VIPLFDIRLSVRMPETVKAVVRAPQNEALVYEQKGDRVEFVLPRLDGRQLIALSFA
jgi:hypothetical protein